MIMNTLNRRILLAAASALLIFPSFGEKNKNVLDLKYSIEDSSIVFPESYEADTQKLMEKWYLQNYTTTDLESTSPDDPGATDDEIRERLADLPTIIDMPFNSIVKSYIERFTKQGRKQVTALLGLSTYYMPIFEQALEEQGLPIELKYLPIVESGLDPTATSKSGAAGLWQFVPKTAQGYNMEFSSLVDERRDPYVSSEKACQLLKSLYEAYGDWTLAIAAYNCGPQTVNKALKRAGGDASDHDFWSIYYYLPEETRGYVPMFIAANYVMNYYPEHDIAPVLPKKPLITDTIHVTNRVHFEQISNVLDIPLDEIRILNPQFRQDIIPGSPRNPYNLILPSQQIHAFLVSEDEIYAYEAEKYARLTEANPGSSNVVAVVAEQEEPLNPADLAPVEAQAAEIAYETTHPQPAATPVRRRVSSNGETSTASQTPVKTQTKPANTQAAQPKPAQAKPASTQAAQTKPANTQAGQTKTNKPAAKNNQAQSTQAANTNAGKKNNKKTETQTTANNNKKNAKAETASNGKNKTKGNNQADNGKTKAKPKETKPVEHTVAQGENLSTIAKKNGTTAEALKKANPQLKNSDVIHPGDKIKIAKPGDNKKADSNSSNSKANAKTNAKDKANAKDKDKANGKNQSKNSTQTPAKKKKK